MAKTITFGVLFLIMILGSFYEAKRQPPSFEYHPTIAFPNLSFDRPLDLQTADDGSNRLFVVEQRGILSVFKNSPKVKQKEIYLDLSEEVFVRNNEGGLQSLIFDPGFKDNGYFYVAYTANNPRRTVIFRYNESWQNFNRANPQSRKIMGEWPRISGDNARAGMVFDRNGKVSLDFSGMKRLGIFYQGQTHPELAGKYIYADFLSGQIWARNADGVNPAATWLLHQNNALYISAFGVDKNDELYFCSFDGRIYKL